MFYQCLQMKLLHSTCDCEYGLCYYHDTVMVSLSFMLADEGTGLQRPAGLLLNILWQLQPSFVTDFVSNKNTPPLLKRLAIVRPQAEVLVMVQLVQSIWSFTASLASEPLLVKAIGKLVQACKTPVGPVVTPQGEPLRPLSESDRQEARNLQVYFLLPGQGFSVLVTCCKLA